MLVGEDGSNVVITAIEAVAVGAAWTAFSCDPGDGLQVEVEVEVEVDHRTGSDLFDRSSVRRTLQDGVDSVEA